jgi:ribosomal protein S21
MYYYKCRFILKSWKRDMNNRIIFREWKIKEIEEYCKKKTTRKKNKTNETRKQGGKTTNAGYKGKYTESTVLVSHNLNR